MEENPLKKLNESFGVPKEYFRLLNRARERI